MSTEIKVPVLGESVVEATVSQWMKAKAKDLSEQNSERPKKKLTLEEDYDQRKDQLRVGMNGWKKNKSNE